MFTNNLIPNAIKSSIIGQFVTSVSSVLSLFPHLMVKAENMISATQIQLLTEKPKTEKRQQP
jgi:hypothetical protein